MDLNSLLNPEEVLNPLTRVLAVPNLLNPEEQDVDILPLIQRIAAFASKETLLVPPEICDHLSRALRHIEDNNNVTRGTDDSQLRSVNTNSGEQRTEQHDVQLTRETTLAILYTYPLNVTVEYPETIENGSVGHLFTMDPRNWTSPILDVVYSRGKPAGQTIKGQEVFTKILRDSGGEPLPCVRTHTTCHGSKPHTSASRADVKERLQNDRDYRLQSTSPSKDVFMRTRLGCRRPLTEETFLLASEEEARDARELYLDQIRRGYRMPEGVCEGRLVFGFSDSDERPYVCKDHFSDSTIGNGAYDVNYIEAVITGDIEEASRIEQSAEDLGYGPLVECTTVSNPSSQRAYCTVSHRDSQGALVQPLLENLPCSSRFVVYEPLEEDRATCPYVLIVTRGPHSHPVPLPTKTPLHIRTTLMDLFKQLSDDLADLTPRRFIRHPILRAFLSKRFPTISSPTLADWHVSLANRSHLKAYIKQARDELYPWGTGWRDNTDADDDEALPKPKDNILRIIICMTPEASRRLLSSGRYLQSDIGFKRIVGFKEFEVAGMERDANTSIVYVRIFLNQMTAAAHQRVFEEIEAIVFEDTGKRLQWHHIHASTVNDGLDSMILSWVADQHRGQAKGLGLHLKNIASKLPPKRDLYEPDRLVQDLGPYEHLHRNFRVCTVHYFRLVQLCGTTEQVSSGFVFEGICWQKSFIPRAIWEAGESNSNLIESVHRDANREGVHCTLLGGLLKGQQFDAMKMKTLAAYESWGITPTYKSAHISENAVSNLKRRDYQTHRRLVAEDAKIEAWNFKFNASVENYIKAQRATLAKRQQLAGEDNAQRRQKLEDDLEKKIRSENRLKDMVEKVYSGRAALGNTGTGKVMLLEAV
ncbi:hypothetical protein B0H16DRAFT_1684672 [Mycena metata]|uniref:Uncharacterized protein n=1 Tax=Mycena metata TaxID=1033252 RepID=A0AAD7JZG1_9AGAR|nr:hypothetical protein B0H16DRAFT_1684672 [Mycena metata]